MDQISEAVANNELDLVMRLVGQYELDRFKESNLLFDVQSAAMIRFLIDFVGIDVNRRNSLTNEPVIIHALKNNWDIGLIKELLAFGADINVKVDGKTILMNAIKSDCIRIASYVLELGADVEIKDDTGEMTALHFAESKRAMELLIHHDADVNSRDKQMETVLIKFVKSNKMAKVRYILGFGADLECKDSLLQSPLHFVKCKKMLKILIDGGADIESKDCRDQTPLFTATKKKRIKIVSTLLTRYKANINLCDKFGCTPLHYAKSRAVVRALIEHKVEIEKKNVAGVTALYLAVIKKRVHVVYELLRHRADVHFKDLKGRSLFHVSGNTQIISLLVRYGARINDSDWNNETALFVAVRNNWKLPVIKELLLNGADVSWRNSNGKTPIHYAENKKIASILIQFGASMKKRIFIGIMDRLLKLGLNGNELTPDMGLFHFLTSYFVFHHQVLGRKKLFEITTKFFDTIINHCSASGPLFPGHIPLRVNEKLVAKKNKIRQYVKKCFKELEQLQLLFVQGRLTFFQFVDLTDEIKLYSIAKNRRNQYTLDQISRYALPIYRDMIMMVNGKGLTRHLLLKRLENENFFSVTERNGSLNKVRLSIDCIYLTMQYLDNRDIMNLLMALSTQNVSYSTNH